MSNRHNHLWPAVYFVKSYIPQLEAFPGDYITVLPGERTEVVLNRFLDRHDLSFLTVDNVMHTSELTPASSPSFVDRAGLETPTQKTSSLNLL